MLTAALIAFWTVLIALVVWRLVVERRRGVPRNPQAQHGRHQGEADARRAVQGPENSAGGIIGGGS